MYLLHAQAHHLFFMIYAEFNIRAHIGFILIYNHFIWAHGSRHPQHCIDMVKRQMLLLMPATYFITIFFLMLLVLSPESLRVSFFPELHRLNVASFHPRHFFFRSKIAYKRSLAFRHSWILSPRKTCSPNMSQKYSERTERQNVNEKKLGKIDDINWFYILDEYEVGIRRQQHIKLRRNIISTYTISYFILNCGAKYISCALYMWRSFDTRSQCTVV